MAALAVLFCGCGDGKNGGAGASSARLDGAEIYAEQCASCHGDFGQGRLGPAVANLSHDRAILVEIIDTRMPADNPARCVGDCAKQVADYVATLTGVAPACDAISPSPRALRLLTRHEYRQSVGSLFGWQAPSGECEAHTFRFSSEDSGITSVHVAGNFNDWRPDATPLARNGRTFTATVPLAPGRYEYKFVINGTQWLKDPANPLSAPNEVGDENSLIEVASCGGQSVAFDPAEYLPPEPRPAEFPFDNAFAQGVVTQVQLEEYLSAAERITERLTTEQLGCSSSDRGCASGLIESIGARAFRRPLTSDESSRYRALAEELGLLEAVQAVLVSPNFLYRTELGQEAGGTYLLTGHEIAAALSYGLWGMPPDEPLLEAAKSGALMDADTRAGHARRLLDAPQARAHLSRFVLQWLGVDELTAKPKSGLLFPDYDDRTAALMLEETRRLFEHVVFDGTGRVDELINADYTFLNPELAAHYGRADATDGWQMVPQTEGRAGVLGHGSVLSAYAHSDQSSPIKRGVFVRNRLLCQSFPPPPPDAGGVPDVDPNATTRERFKQHTEEARCAACHQYIDDVGFGFEHFDAVGRYRDSENGKPVDALGNMNDIEDIGNGTSAPFSTLEELGSSLVQSDALYACFAKQMYRFVRGFKEGVHERCAVEQAEQSMREGDNSVVELVVGIVSSPDFVERRQP